MRYVNCRVCGQACDPQQHRCPPAWLVWADGSDEEDGSKIFAMDAETAAMVWAEKYDECPEVPIAREGRAFLVCVRGMVGSEVTRWRVSGEYVPTYYVSQEQDT